jgi:threonylcarbamoyladenosine tRNA methylthiotransferase MtaB
MKIYLDSVGCRLNQAEIENFARQFRAAGHILVSNSIEADLMVLNTCSVTSKADSDSRQKIRQAYRNGCQEIIATGCLATLHPNEIMKIPGIQKVISNSEKAHLVRDCCEEVKTDQNVDLVSRLPIPGRRERTRAFIKAQDGCNHHCTYCITRIARGKAASEPIATIISEINAAISGGVKEAILCGVQLGSWGYELNPVENISMLVKAILGRTELPRLRLSSIEPWGLNDEFFALWENPRMCRQLHLPMQSGSEKILKRMNRNNTKESYEAIVRSMRNACPTIAITTDVLVGFPGETEEDFSDTLDFIRRNKFAGGHVFTYSKRPGAGADLLSNPVLEVIKRERSAMVRKELKYLAYEYQQQFLGKTLPVLWESSQKTNTSHFYLKGWTDNYIRVATIANQNRHNQIDSALIVKKENDAWKAQIQ